MNEAHFNLRSSSSNSSSLRDQARKDGTADTNKIVNILSLKCSLRVAVPTPRGKTGGRERLRKTDTNRLLCLEYGI